MDKGFQFKSLVLFPDFPNLPKRQFTRKDYAARAKLTVKRRALVVCDVCLRADVDFEALDLPRDVENAGVGDDNRVRSDIPENAQIAVKAAQILIVRDDVHADVNLDAAAVGITDGLFQFIGIEIPGVCAQTEPLPPDVNGVRAVRYGYPQLFKIPRGGKQLGFFLHDQPLFP
jgi:hypothetical protein